MGEEKSMGQTGKGLSDLKRKYLSFSSSKKEYGIRTLKGKEISGVTPITPIPRTPILLTLGMWYHGKD